MKADKAATNLDEIKQLLGQLANNDHFIPFYAAFGPNGVETYSEGLISARTVVDMIEKVRPGEN